MAGNIARVRAADKYLGIRVGTTTHPLLMLKVANVSKIARGVNKALGLGERDQFGKLTKAEDANLSLFNSAILRTDHTLRTLFSTAYNKPPGMKNVSDVAWNQINSFIHESQNQLSDLARSAEPHILADAWKNAQLSNFEGPNGAIAKEIHDRMENVFGEHGLVRNLGITPEQMAPFMRQVFRENPKALEHFQFINDPKSGLVNPFDSWRQFPVLEEGRFSGNVARQMLGLEAAAQKTAGRALVMDHAATQFGVPTSDTAAFAKAKDAGYVAINTPGDRLKDLVFPPDLAEPLGKFLRITSVGARGDSEALKLYDTGLRIFKKSMTMYFPGHHINNSIGQTLNAFVADGLLPSNKAYRTALRVVNAHAPVNPKEWGMVGPTAEMGMKNALQFRGQTYDSSQLWQMFSNSGAKQAFAAFNDELGGPLTTLNKVSQGVQKFSDARENMQRLAHFTYLLNRDKASKTLEEAVGKAAQRVNEVHADYTDLTDFEKSVMRRIIPFYTWQRRVGPVLFKQMFTDPGRTMVVPKLQAEIGRHFGMQNSNDEAFPQPTELVPSYMQDLLQTKLPGGYGGIRSPFADVVGKYSNSPTKELLSSASPLIKTPIALLSGANPETGAKLPSKVAYVANQFGPTQALQSITRHDVLGRPMKDPRKYPDMQNLSTVAIINKLTGVPIQPVTSSSRNSARREIQKRQSAVNIRKIKPLAPLN